MYHGAARDRGDKKRQRLTPPPNEVWMEAIMSKGKNPDGYIPASAISARGVATSSTGAWPDRARPSDWAAPQSSGPPGATQYQQHITASRFQGREVERPVVYQGIAPGNSAGYQTRPMDTGYQGRTMDGPIVYQGRTSTTSGPYQGRTVVTSATYPGRTVDNSTGYQTKTMDVPSRYQGRPMDGATGYQGRQMNAPAGYQERTTNGPAGYQGRMADGSVPYQGRLIQGSPAYQGKVMDGSTASKMYQNRPVPTSSSGKMAEDYKRERKLPPRVEEMLREQVNLDESVLHDAFAVAMEDLIPEEEANFVAKGLCHLCGVSEKHFVPVVNFCPHADENHSLCREHLRSVYRVRMEALFVGRNGSAPNRRLLRCLVCTRGCPCTGCTADKEQDVQKYKRYLLDTLRRSGQGLMTAVKDDSATAASAATAVSTPTSEGRLTYGSAPKVGGSNGRRYVQYPPAPPAEGRPPPIQRGEGFTFRGAEAKETHEERRRTQTQLTKYEADEQSSRDGYAPSMQTQSKSPSHYAAVRKRAAKDTPADMLSVMADSATDPRVAARAATSRVHQGSVESPSADTVINCVESEKSLVQLLSSLNQGEKPATSTSSQSSKTSSHLQGEARPSSNGIAPRSENTQGSGDVDMETAPQTHSAVADRRNQTGSPYQEQSSTSSIDSADSPQRPSVGARPVEEYPTRTASDSETEERPAQRDSDDMSSRDDAPIVKHTEVAAREEANEMKRQDHSDGSPMLSVKADTRKMENVPKAEITGNHSVLDLKPSSPPPPLHRGPGRPRKHPLPEGYTQPRNSQQKTSAPMKRGRGRPPKRPKRTSEEDDETEEEAYRAEDDEEDEDEDEDERDGRDASDSELDTNLDFCEVCQRAGDLVCCDKCPRSFHLKCLHMTENDLPEGDWQCKECKKPSRFDAYSTAVASEQSLLDKCLKIVECLKSHPFSKPFLTPVENVPLYTKVVKQPMDLSRIETKLKKGAYIVDSNTVASGVKELDFTHFANDIRLMWSNCKIFNDDGSGITRAADILSAGFERLYKESIEPPLTLS